MLVTKPDARIACGAREPEPGAVVAGAADPRGGARNVGSGTRQTLFSPRPAPAADAAQRSAP